MNKALKMSVMKVIKKTSFQNILYMLPRHKKGRGVGLKKMSDLIKYIIERMVEGTVEGTCAVMLHMLKYVPGVQGVDVEAVDIGGCPLAYVHDLFKTQGCALKLLR